MVFIPAGDHSYYARQDNREPMTTSGFLKEQQGVQQQYYQSENIQENFASNVYYNQNADIEGTQLADQDEYEEKDNTNQTYRKMPIKHLPKFRSSGLSNAKLGGQTKIAPAQGTSKTANLDDRKKKLEVLLKNLQKLDSAIDISKVKEKVEGKQSSGKLGKVEDGRLDPGNNIGDALSTATKMSKFTHTVDQMFEMNTHRDDAFESLAWIVHENFPVTNYTVHMSIVPFLYLSLPQNASDEVLLAEIRVSTVICVGQTKPSKYVKGVEYIVFEMRDDPYENVLSYFDLFYEHVEKIISGESAVLVCCGENFAISSTFAIAFLMKRYRLSLPKAIATVRNRIKFILPNYGFLSQLEIYEKLNFRVERTSVPYRYFMLAHCHFLMNSELGVSIQFDPDLPNRSNIRMAWNKYFKLVKLDQLSEEVMNINEFTYRCRSCHIPVFYEYQIVAGPETETPNSLTETIERCQSLFIEPQEWMMMNSFISMQDGILMCNHCGNMIGCYDLRGTSCYNNKKGRYCAQHPNKHVNMIEIFRDEVFNCNEYLLVVMANKMDLKEYGDEELPRDIYNLLKESVSSWPEEFEEMQHDYHDRWRKLETDAIKKKYDNMFAAHLKAEEITVYQMQKAKMKMEEKSNQDQSKNKSKIKTLSKKTSVNEEAENAQSKEFQLWEAQMKAELMKHVEMTDEEKRRGDQEKADHKETCCRRHQRKKSKQEEREDILAELTAKWKPPMPKVATTKKCQDWFVEGIRNWFRFAEKNAQAQEHLKEKHGISYDKMKMQKDKSKEENKEGEDVFDSWVDEEEKELRRLYRDFRRYLIVDYFNGSMGKEKRDGAKMSKPSKPATSKQHRPHKLKPSVSFAETQGTSNSPGTSKQSENVRQKVDKPKTITSAKDKSSKKPAKDNRQLKRSQK